MEVQKLREKTVAIKEQILLRDNIINEFARKVIESQ